MLLGALLGLIGSSLPEIFKLFRDRQERKHEKEMLQLQVQLQQQLAEIRIKEAQELQSLKLEEKVYDFADVTAPRYPSILTTIAYLYNTSVRPTVTYLLIGLYMLVKWAQVKMLMSGGIEFYKALLDVWTSADSEFVGAVVAFWFGSRQFLKRR